MKRVPDYRFPRGKSIADIIRIRYGEAFIKKNMKVWKVQFQIVEMALRSEGFFGLQEKRCYSKVSPF